MKNVSVVFAGSSFAQTAASGLGPNRLETDTADTVALFTSDVDASGAYSQFDVVTDAQGPFELSIGPKVRNESCLGMTALSLKDSAPASSAPSSFRAHASSRTDTN